MLEGDQQFTTRERNWHCFRTKNGIGEVTQGALCNMNKTRKKPLNLPVSSINVPSIVLEEDRLTMRFCDWHQRTVEIVFDGVVTYRWVNKPDDSGIQDDAMFEIRQSDWKSLCAEEFALAANDVRRLRHYQYCVFECWCVDILCEGFSGPEVVSAG
ncbi:hypothetical protein Q4485_00545 [Granulosicoccaceae sp. 1_MG-2023]|nr:hypothetical protein [Granulosicoccaceae sp. 1_MG-2023]